MSHPSSHLNDDDDGPELKPRPRGRVFNLSSAPPSAPSTPPSDTYTFSSNLQAPTAPTEGSVTPSRTRSILNLTSSTLFGIYQPTGYANDREEPSTPWGTGAQTPLDSRNGSFDFTRSDLPDTLVQQNANGSSKLRRKSTVAPLHRRPRRGFKGYVLPLVARTVTLFGAGVLYGLLISQLHDKQKVVPVKVTGLNRQGWPYLSFWGVVAVLLGEGLPWLDMLWTAGVDQTEEQEGKQQRSGHGSGDWLDVVRTIGAFVGIAFAIRKLPWQSTLQLSLTLALANPAVWFLVDRSPSGFMLSTVVALTGTAAILGISPTLVPPPPPGVQGHVPNHGSGMNDTAHRVVSDDLVFGMFSHESVGVATWIASVLFVSSICFGNIGRRLAPRAS